MTEQYNMLSSMSASKQHCFICGEARLLGEHLIELEDKSKHSNTSKFAGSIFMHLECLQKKPIVTTSPGMFPLHTGKKDSIPHTWEKISE